LAALQKAGQSPSEFLSLHVRGQWGDIPEEDRRENEYSLQRGFRLLSSYRTNANETIWVVTESLVRNRLFWAWFLPQLLPAGVALKAQFLDAHPALP